MKRIESCLIATACLLLVGLCASSCSMTESTTAGGNSTGVVRKGDVEVIRAPWGTLQWLVSGPNGTSEKMTFGRVTFKPGVANPPHYHPKSEEILFVIQGTLEHSLPGGGTTILHPGDCIVLPPAIHHNAKNVGKDEAVVVVCYSSAYRQKLD